MIWEDEKCLCKMRRLKIMRDDVPMACGDEFGVSDINDVRWKKEDG